MPTSLRLWGGVFLLCYGVSLEANYHMARYAAPFRGAYYVSLVAFALMASWRLAVWSQKFVKLLWPVVLVIGIAGLILGLYYVPWFLPFYYGNIRFHWPEYVDRALESIYKVLLITVGTGLVVSYVLELRRSAVARNDEPYAK